MFVNLSNILIKFSKDLFDPSNIKDASSAKEMFYFIFLLCIYLLYRAHGTRIICINCD